MVHDISTLSSPAALPSPAAPSVQLWLEERVAVACPTLEPRLFAALSSRGRETVNRRLALVKAIATAAKRVGNVQAAIATVMRGGLDAGLSPKRVRSLYDAWAKSGDWLVLVQRTAERAEWRVGAVTSSLPEAFLEYVACQAGQYKRADAMAQALRAVLRVWTTGRNPRGEREAVPGYGYWPEWYEKIHPGQPLPAVAPTPTGWSDTNIRAQIKARGKFSKAVKAALHESVAKARDFTPQVHATRAGLLFLQEVQFDDVRCDFRVFDPQSGEVMDLWLLVARDRATSCMLGFGMRPARSREDGSQEHLRLVDMKQLCGWVLERWGLPPYRTTWKLENGTATLDEAVSRALGHLTDGRLAVSYARMHGGTSPAGYIERAKGNSRGKAMLESLNRSQHILTSGLPGQMGRNYEVRPADLKAREKEAVAIWQAAHCLPEHLRRDTEYPLVTLAEARAALRESFLQMDARTEHSLEGFDRVLEWRRSPHHLWTLTAIEPVPHPLPFGAEVRQRWESPAERMRKLVEPHRAQWTAVSPDVVAAFYEHTQRDVRVDERGEVTITIEGVRHYYRPGAGMAMPEAGAKLLGYFHPDFPDYLHLFRRTGQSIGIWPKVKLVDDEPTLRAAIEASESAVKAVKQRAADLGAGERERLEAMRTHNAELMRQQDAIDVTPQVTDAPMDVPVSTVATALRRAKDTLRAAKRAATQQATDTADDEATARAALNGF